MIFGILVRTIRVISSYLPSVVLGQEAISVPINADNFYIQGQKLANIDVQFCDKPDEKSIHYTVGPGKVLPICLEISNYDKEDARIHIGFVDGTVTADQRKNLACKLDEHIEEFGQYVTGYSNPITIPAQSRIRYFVYFHYPQDIYTEKKSIWGCLVYYIPDISPTSEQSEGIGVRVRRAKFIHVTIQKKIPSSIGGYLEIIIGVGIIGLILLLGWKIKYKKIMFSMGK